MIGVHNEIGSIQKLAEIGEICRERKVFFHTDCAQAVGKIPIDVKDMKIDLMSISGHKVSPILNQVACYSRSSILHKFVQFLTKE